MNGPTRSARSVPVPTIPRTDRLAWIEFGRTIAIVAVIAIHVASPLVTRAGHPGSWWFGNILEATSRWCVPLFVMISGGLLLGSSRTAEPVDFYQRRLARVGPPMVFWIGFYLVLGHLASGVPRDLGGAFRSIALGRPWYHLYFLFVIAGLYVVAPWLRMLVERASRSLLAVGIGVAFALAMTDSLLGSFLGIGSPNAVTRFAPYLGYFLAGYLLEATAPSGRRAALAGAILAASIAATAIGTWILVDVARAGLGGGRYLYEYLSVTTVPAALSVYLLVRWSAGWLTARSGGWDGRVVTAVGAASFGIYLVHPTLLLALESIGITARATVAPLAVAVTGGIALVGSFLIVVIAHRVPVIRRLV